MTLDEIEHLAHHLPADDRPAWLRNMPSASDNQALYYRFFDALVQQFGPLDVLELGTYHGTSLAHLAYANSGFVVSIDVDERAREIAAGLDKWCVAMIDAVVHDTLTLDVAAARRSWSERRLDPALRFDVLFIDTRHTFAQAMAEFERYSPLVRDGGLVFFDDLLLGAEMRALWEALPEPKRRLDALHYTGFGVVQIARTP